MLLPIFCQLNYRLRAQKTTLTVGVSCRLFSMLPACYVSIHIARFNLIHDQKIGGRPSDTPCYHFAAAFTGFLQGTQRNDFFSEIFSFFSPLASSVHSSVRTSFTPLLLPHFGHSGFFAIKDLLKYLSPSKGEKIYLKKILYVNNKDGVRSAYMR